MIDLIDSLFRKIGVPATEGVLPEITFIILIALVVNLLVLFILRYLAKQASKTEISYDDIIIKSAKKPVSWLIWAMGVSFALEVMSVNQPGITPYVPITRSISFIVLVSWFLLSFIGQSEPVLIKTAEDSEKLDHTTFLAISRLLKVSVLIVASLMVLQNLGMSISAVLAFGGVGGIAVGFAARDLLANFFGGLMIFLDKPFSLGDWVRSPDRNIEGTVEKINWRLTVIRTFDQRPLYIPNAIFNSIAIENPSRMTNRRIYETIGLRYCDIDKLEKIIAAVETMIKNHPDIDTNKTLMVNFNEFAASSLNFFIYTFTKTTNWQEFHKVKQDVLFKVIEIIENHEAEVAFPTQTLHIEQAEKN